MHRAATPEVPIAEPGIAGASHLRLVRPPETEPPTSQPPTSEASTPGTRRAVSPFDAPVQGTLALLFTLPNGSPAIPAPPRALQLVSYRPALAYGPEPDADDDVDEPVLTPRADLPDPRRWSARLVQAAVEARHGDRPIAQLLRWTTRSVYDQLTRESAPVARSSVARRRTVRPVIRSLHLSEPADGVVEACAVVYDGVRGRAVALRMEGLDGRWLCTALDIV